MSSSSSVIERIQKTNSEQQSSRVETILHFDSQQNSGKNKLNGILDKYNNRMVRDLIWVIASPAIMASEIIKQYPGDEILIDWIEKSATVLKKLDKSPQPLEEFINQSKTNRLGEIFERFWHFWLSDCQSKSVVAADYRVQLKDRTLGAFDLLVDERENKHLGNEEIERGKLLNPLVLTHYELAVKFYLNTARGIRMSDWYGAEQSDRLDKKINRMVEHQLKLSHYQATEKLLKQKYWQIEKIIGVCKGRLFLNAFMPKTSRPDWMNTNALLGFWCPASQFHAVQKERLLHWYLLEKKYWLAPLSAADTNEMEIIAEQKLLGFPQTLNQVIQIAGCDRVENKEQIRGFIVPDEWLLKLHH